MLFINTEDSILGELSQDASAKNQNSTKEQQIKNLFNTSQLAVALSNEIPIFLAKKED